MFGHEHPVRSAYGVYVIATREIWAPRAGSTLSAGLAEPPRDASAFSDFGDQAVRSLRISSILANASSGP